MVRTSAWTSLDEQEKHVSKSVKENQAESMKGCRFIGVMTGMHRRIAVSCQASQENCLFELGRQEIL